MNPADDPFSCVDDGATPLDPDECAGLKLGWVTTRADLNAAEADNIAEARAWAQRARRLDLVSVEGLQKLHARMFGDVWAWAGRFRTTERNIGLAPHDIAPALHNLVADVTTWLEFHSYPPLDMIARFHHRLVHIHPFANGNGRHARLAVELFARRHRIEVPSWGMGRPIAIVRGEYLAALRAADRHDYAPLRAFLGAQPNTK